MGNRVAVQAVETKFPALILLWGERQRHQDTDFTLIANLLLTVIKKRIKRSRSFSGLASMVRIMLMYYVNCYTFLEEPEKDWAKMVQEALETPPEPSLVD